MDTPNGEDTRILTPIGMLGYGVPEEEIMRVCQDKVDAIIVDAGSTDPGPYLLGLDKCLMPDDAYARDLQVLVKAAQKSGATLIISSAGGAGTKHGVDTLVRLTQSAAQQQGWTPKIATISADIPKQAVLDAWQAQAIRPCGAAHTLLASHIEDATNIVAQMGAEPFIEALKTNPEVIIAGRSYDPSPFAAVCMRAGIDEATAWHAGKITECGAVCAEPKGKAVLALVRPGSFEVEPLADSEKCTPLSVAAHSFYEKSDPLHLAGPGHVLHLEDVTYTAVSDRKTRVSGAVYTSVPYEIKLEGAGILGYRTVLICGIRDPVLINTLGEFLVRIKRYVASIYGELDAKGVSIVFHEYGTNGVMGGTESAQSSPHEVALITEVVAPSQKLADSVCATVRVALLHGPYPGQMSTGGNIALPISPSELSVGPVCSFTMYHLMKVADPLQHFTIETLA